MDVTEFRERAVELIDYIVDYLESISLRRVTPDISPGYLSCLLPANAPDKGESFDKIMEDFEKFILPGMTHWQHPHFHAHFPSCASYPSILAEIVTGIVGCSGYNYRISPAVIDLESIVLDWFGKMIGLPDSLLRYGEGSHGSGNVNNTCSECVSICLLTARDEAVSRLKDKNPVLCKDALLSSLMAYCSKEAHYSVEKAGILTMVNMRILDVDEEFRLSGKTLTKALEEDKKRGLIPFFVSITLGTSSCCSCDPIDEIGLVCEANGIWLHVDAAYAGTALICPEYKYLLKGVEKVSSFAINASKWLPLHQECAVFWSKDCDRVNESIVYDCAQLNISDRNDKSYRNNKRFLALKLWFVIRSYGVEGLQKHVRNHVRLARMFANYARDDDRFEVMANSFGLVCFRLKGPNSVNKRLIAAINESSKLHVSGCTLGGKYNLRFCVGSIEAKEEDMTYAWAVVLQYANDLLMIKTGIFH